MKNVRNGALARSLLVILGLVLTGQVVSLSAAPGGALKRAMATDHGNRRLEENNQVQPERLVLPVI